MRFSRHIGIDYSGAQTRESRLKGLQVYESRNGGTPERIGTGVERSDSAAALTQCQKHLTDKPALEC